MKQKITRYSAGKQCIDTVNMSIRLMYSFQIVFVLEVIFSHDFSTKNMIVNKRFNLSLILQLNEQTLRFQDLIDLGFGEKSRLSYTNSLLQHELA